MDRETTIKDVVKQIKDPELKPDGVKIVMFTANAVPTTMGGLGLMIIGLGTDERIYSYNTTKCIWTLQK